jgi:hypothetical protein
MPSRYTYGANTYLVTLHTDTRFTVEVDLTNLRFEAAVSDRTVTVVSTQNGKSTTVGVEDDGNNEGRAAFAVSVSWKSLE